MDKICYERTAEYEKILCVVLIFSANLAKPIDKRKKKVYNHFIIGTIINQERRLEQ